MWIFQNMWEHFGFYDRHSWNIFTFSTKVLKQRKYLAKTHVVESCFKKVSKSQKHFSSNCIAQKTSEIFDNILPQLRRAEFFQIFHSFLGQWSFNKKFFWDLLTFICSEGCIGDPLYHLSKQLGNFFRDYLSTILEA